MAKAASNVTPGTDEEWETKVAPFAPTFKFENEGVTLTGVFTAKRTVDQPDLNSEVPGDTRAANVYEIQSDADGSKYSVWGNYAIDLAFQDIVEGQTVRISYWGKENLSGGRTVNKMQVDVKK
jgi:hypothetical protein